jgi:hypothetical protein
MRQRETSDPARSLSRKGRDRKARRDLIRIVLIIAIFGTAIVLTCELDTVVPAFVIAIVLFVFAARPGVPPARHPPPPPPPHHRHEYTRLPRRACINSTVPSTPPAHPAAERALARVRLSAERCRGGARVSAAGLQAMAAGCVRAWLRDRLPWLQHASQGGETPRTRARLPTAHCLPRPARSARYDLSTLCTTVKIAR